MPKLGASCKITLLGIAMVTLASSVEVRMGKGEFSASASMAKFWEFEASSDVDVLSVSIPRYNIATHYYLFGSLDIYSSKRIEWLSGFADWAMETNLPFFPSLTPNSLLSNFVPVPSSYEVEGIDANIGVAKDVVTKPQYRLGVGVLTGFSTPFIKMQNYLDALSFYSDILEYSDTQIKTYKAGMLLEGVFRPHREWNIFAKAIYAYQRGDIRNAMVLGAMKSAGSYGAFEAGVRYTPSALNNFYISAGYQHKNWQLDSVEVEINPFPSVELSTPLGVEFSSHNSYISIGYRF